MFRVWTYLVSLLSLIAFAYHTKKEFELFPPVETWSMILGYLAFILIGLTLLIGPVKQWLPPTLVPHLLKIRRDLGILAGSAGVLHVALVLYLFETDHSLFILGNNDYAAPGWVGLFFQRSVEGGDHLYANLSMPGVANYIGAVALLVLLSLWLTSSDQAQRLLGGAGWKRLHLQNPLLFLLVLFHAVIYIRSIKGAPHTLSDFLWLAAIVFILRGVGFLYTVYRRR